MLCMDQKEGQILWERDNLGCMLIIVVKWAYVPFPLFGKTIGTYRTSSLPNDVCFNSLNLKLWWGEEEGGP